jgi:hypothetical protein
MSEGTLSVVPAGTTTEAEDCDGCAVVAAGGDVGVVETVVEFCAEVALVEGCEGGTAA